MLYSEDVAYIISVIEKSPSVNPRRKQIIEELQSAWRASNKIQRSWRVPVAPSFGVIEFTAYPAPVGESNDY